MKETDFRKHPAIADSDLIGAGLCSLPDLGELTMIRVGRESSERLKSLGIHVSGANYDSNFVLLHRDSRNVNATISFSGGNNYLVFGRTVHFHGKIHISGHRNVFLSCGITSRAQVLDLEIRNDENAFVAGKEVSWNGVSAIMEGPRNRIVIADGSMFSWGIKLNGSDRHAIVELSEVPKQINLPKPIDIEPYVWVGEDAVIMKGVRIGRGSVIATRAIVTKNVPPFCAAAGAPAKVVRRNITWMRESQPDAQSICSWVEFQRPYFTATGGDIEDAPAPATEGAAQRGAEDS